MQNSNLIQWCRIVRGALLSLVAMTVLVLVSTPAAAATDIVAINAGGLAVSNSGGGDAPFVADEYFSGGGRAVRPRRLLT